jgi:predicted RNase H-like HicB family nuclease
MREAIAFHLEGLREKGLPIPPATSLCEYVEVSG